MQQFLSRTNIENFEKQLATTTDETKKLMLKMLIEEEREKLRQLRQR